MKIECQKGKNNFEISKHDIVQGYKIIHYHNIWIQSLNITISK